MRGSRKHGSKKATSEPKILHYTWVVVKIRVPFWVPQII